MTSPGPTLALARQLFDDATVLLKKRSAFCYYLDHAMAATEFRRVLGRDCGVPSPRESFTRAFGSLAAEPDVGPWLYRGAAQAGWVAEQLVRAGELRPVRLDNIDEVVLTWLRDYPADATIDLPRGALGLGVYALNCAEPAARAAMLVALLQLLDDRAVREPDGICYPIPATENHVQDGSAGCRIVGVAHGAAGVVSLLASVLMAEPRLSDRVTPLLDASLNWLLAQRNDVGHGVFAHRAEAADASARPTWCSGDPGVAVALELVSRATGSAAALAAAKHATVAVCNRPDDDSGVVDACLCHGAAGLVWFAGEQCCPAAAELARRWTAWIGQRRAEGGLTYFSPWGMIRDCSFLEGDLGVAMVLLRAASGGTASWRELLLATRVGAER